MSENEKYIIELRKDYPSLYGVMASLGIAILNDGIIKDEYDKAMKETAQFLIDELGINIIPIQIFANGNLDHPQEVLAEAQIHIALLDNCDEQTQ